MGHGGRIPDDGRKLRVARVGTGIRGTGFWGSLPNDNCGESIEFAALCDSNPVRLEFARRRITADCATHSHFGKMLATAPLGLLMVCTVDSTHDEFIVTGLASGIDVVTEKSTVTDKRQCQADIDAARNSSARGRVALNYLYDRFSGGSRRKARPAGNRTPDID